MDRPARPPACYVARWEEEAALPLAQWGVLSLSRALVGSLYIKINIPTYSRRLPFTEKSTRSALSLWSVSRPRAVLRLRAPVRPRLGSSLRLSAAGAVRGCCGAVRARALLHVAPHRARVLEQREGHGHLGLG